MKKLSFSPKSLVRSVKGLPMFLAKNMFLALLGMIAIAGGLILFWFYIFIFTLDEQDLGIVRSQITFKKEQLEQTVEEWDVRIIRSQNAGQTTFRNIFTLPSFIFPAETEEEN